MKRLSILIVLALFLGASPGAAQTAAPAQKAKFIPPVKGVATVDLQRVSQKRVGNEMQTIIKVRNTSKGSINLLKVDQYWYDGASKQVSFGDYRHRKAPIQPGEVVEITIMAPSHPQIRQDMLMLSHANGKIDVKQVKKIE